MGIDSVSEDGCRASVSVQRAWWRPSGVVGTVACLLLLVALAPHAAEAQTREGLVQAQSTLEQCRQREASCRGELQTLRQDAAELQTCQKELNACKGKLSGTFLTVVIHWPTERHDVDLHVIDAAGEEFSYQRRTIAGRPGELRVDTTRGPGMEIWEVPEAPTGEYRVLYNLYDKQGNQSPVVVRGGVYHRDGRDHFRERRLTRQGRQNAVLVAVVTVADDGNVEISEP